MTPPENEAHLFLVSAETFRTSYLSAEEQERAARFRFDEDRQTFTAARSALRMILGRYLECLPADVEFSAGPQGKLLVHRPVSDSPIYFNLSHSNRYAVIAITGAGPIGVDLEKIRLDVAEDEISRRYFSVKEQQWLQERPPIERKRDFFRLWVLKESIIKADGRGLFMPLDDAQIEFIDGAARVLSGEWWVQELQLIENYAAAVACSRQCRLLIMDS